MTAVAVVTQPSEAIVSRSPGGTEARISEIVGALPSGHPGRSRPRPAAQVDEARQPPLGGQAVDGREEALQPGECLLAFQPAQLRRAPLPRVVPAAGDFHLLFPDVLRRYPPRPPPPRPPPAYAPRPPIAT